MAAEKAEPVTLEPEVEVSCVVCGGNAFTTVCPAQEIEVQRHYLRWFHRRRLRPDAPPEALADRAEFTQDYATDVVSCADCGLLLRNPRPRRDAIARAYQQDDYGIERLNSLFATQRALCRPKSRFLQRWLRPGARVVEVGSFVGGFLAAGREQGWEMLGIDPGEEVAVFCEARGLPVVRATLADAPVANGSADAIAIWNTFDQMPDPGPTLAAARRLLRPGGLLAIRVPNGACFQEAAVQLRRFRHSRRRLPASGLLCALAWNNLLAFPYLYGYPVPTLDRLFSRYGLRRVHARGDTLVPLGDAQTRPWAIWEERIVKAICRLAARLEALRPQSRFTLAPWLDGFYQSCA